MSLVLNLKSDTFATTNVAQILERSLGSALSQNDNSSRNSTGSIPLIQITNLRTEVFQQRMRQEPYTLHGYHLTPILLGRCLCRRMASSAGLKHWAMSSLSSRTFPSYHFGQFLTRCRQCLPSDFLETLDESSSLPIVVPSPMSTSTLLSATNLHNTLAPSSSPDELSHSLPDEPAPAIPPTTTKTEHFIRTAADQESGFRDDGSFRASTAKAC